MREGFFFGDFNVIGKEEIMPDLDVRPDTRDCDSLIAEMAERQAAETLGMSLGRLRSVLGASAWGTAHQMLRREFRGRYKGYYPSCGMTDDGEGVIAEVFDALADACGGPRRAVRWGVRHG
ncbi:hypothetical protein [Palleronia caenipelagi]|uniref:Uncharacterized protein n=1 Tax=Palleronia caenipelagi TaxID=2489174 RepID=A0A547PT40_9RHOB|nr:hypothetical protein [Palleronia caenipelagi]TRD17313.1 hypothetical protein FEV53_13355 [Palleronia caenipelagi]